jgi:hypothetical protein
VAHAGPVAAQIAREAAGVPMFVRELVHHVTTKAADEPASLSLAQLLASRFGSLSDRARQLIALLALAARPVPAPVLAHAVASRAGWPATLRALQSRGLIRGDGKGAFVIYHDRFRELCVDVLPAPERAALHRALARAYEYAQHADPELPIEHWRGAGDLARALECALAAAAAADTKLAFHRAAALFATALEIIEPNDPTSTCSSVRRCAMPAGVTRRSARSWPPRNVYPRRQRGRCAAVPRSKRCGAAMFARGRRWSRRCSAKRISAFPKPHPS